LWKLKEDGFGKNEPGLSDILTDPIDPTEIYGICNVFGLKYAI